MSNDVRELVVKAYKAGVPPRYLAERFGVEYNRIKWWIEHSKKDAARNEEYDAILGALDSTNSPLETHIAQSYTTPQTVLVIPDLHCPFEHIDSLEFLQAVQERYKTTTTVCLGDEIDAHALGRWPKNPDGMSAGKETKEAIEHLRPFYLAFPEMKVCTSNHTIRPWKMAFDSGLPQCFMKTVETVLNAPDGWQWDDKWEIDNVLYIHGEGKSGQNAHLAFLRAYKQSVVHGHIHSYGGVTTEGEHFAMNTGCLIDNEAYAFAYGKKLPIKPSLGCGVVFEGKHALFIRMSLDENGRWDGKIYG